MRKPPAKPALGIIGFGQFGQFMASHLTPHFQVFAFDKHDYRKEMTTLGVQSADLNTIAHLPIIILAIPVQHLEKLLRELGPLVQSGTLVIDVASVKVKPVALMQHYLASDVEIIGTHPLFGPQSGKDGIKGLRIAVSPVRTTKLAHVTHFLSNTLELAVIEINPNDHDRHMAYVQGLSHLISRGLHELTIPDTPLMTKAYEDLLSMTNYLGSDSYELFLTIERENPFAREVRQRFIAQLTDLHHRIASDQ